MTKRKARYGHCHRCIYTWRMRRRSPPMCPRCKSRLWRIPKIRPIQLGRGIGIEEVIGPHRAEVQRLAQKYGVKTVRVFGSVRRREATPSSDVDLMLEWRRPVSLLEVAGLHIELEKALGRAVDLVNRGDLHWALAPQVEAESVLL